MGISRLPGLSLAINTGRPPYPILGDPGAVSWAGRKGERKGFKPRWKTPWVLTLTRDSHDRVSSCRVQTHEKNWGDAVHRLGTIIQSIFCASTRLTIIFWKWSGESQYPGGSSACAWKLLSHFFSQPDWPPLGLRGCLNQEKELGFRV